MSVLCLATYADAYTDTYTDIYTDTCALPRESTWRRMELLCKAEQRARNAGICSALLRCKAWAVHHGFSFERSMAVALNGRKIAKVALRPKSVA
jgi:hypothetical protein